MGAATGRFYYGDFRLWREAIAPEERYARTLLQEFQGIDQDETRTSQERARDGEAGERVRLQRIDAAMRDGSESGALERVADALRAVAQRQVADDGRVLDSLADGEEPVREWPIPSQRDAFGA